MESCPNCTTENYTPGSPCRRCQFTENLDVIKNWWENLPEEERLAGLSFEQIRDIFVQVNPPFNGWMTWETWNVYTWISNEEWTYYLAKADPSQENLVSIAIRCGKDEVDLNLVDFKRISEVI